MSLILDEKEWAREMITTRDLGDHALETLDRVARYYRQVEGCSRAETRRQLELFLVRCDPYANLVAWSDTLDKLAKNAAKYKLVEIDGITITRSEMDAIASVGSMSTQRLAFTLLFLAKYWNEVHSDNDNWVNTSDKETLAMANVRTSIKRQCDMFHKLRESGFIQFSKRVDNLNVRVLPVSTDENDEPVLCIADTRNIGNQYMMYRGEPYFPCEVCGTVVRRKSARQKYCPSCADEVRSQQAIASVRRRRQERALERKMAEKTDEPTFICAIS